MSSGILVFETLARAKKEGVVEQMGSSLNFRGFFCPNNLCNTVFRPREFSRGRGVLRE